MKNYYQVLNVKSNATHAQIRKAFLVLVSKYHPDIYQGDKDYADDYTTTLTEAYNVLKDPDKRRDYDIGNHINSSSTIYQTYAQNESDNIKTYSNGNYEQEVSSKQFRNRQSKRPTGNFFKKVFTSKLFYCLLFVFAIEAIVIYLVLSS